MKSFDKWLKRVPKFREAIDARRKKKEEIRIGQIAEAVKVAVETIEKKQRQPNWLN